MTHISKLDIVPKINVPHPNGLAEPYPVPDVSQWVSALNPGPGVQG